MKKKFALVVAMLCIASAAQATEWNYWTMNALAKFKWGVDYGLWYQTRYDCLVEKKGNYDENHLPDKMEWARQSDITDYVRDHCIPNKKPADVAHAEVPPKNLEAKPREKEVSAFKWPNPPQLQTQVNESSPFNDRWQLLSN